MRIDTISKQLLFSTVRIEAFDDEGGPRSVGTGFIVARQLDQANQQIALVTNKHVINKTDEVGRIVGKFKQGMIFFTRQNKDGSPDIGNRHNLVFQEDFTDRWFGHQDNEVDIAIMPLPPILQKLKNDEVEIFYRSIPLELVPTVDQEENIDALEEVIFVGYPSGIFDQKNLLPIMRKGITATPYPIDFEGRKIFLIDASVFQGSSGSPVFIYKTGGYSEGRTFKLGATKLFFCGIVSRSFRQSNEGKLIVKPIPTNQNQITVETSQMLDLGLVYKASLIAECMDQYI